MRRLWFILAVTALLWPAPAQPKIQEKGIWAHPLDLGTNEQEVGQFFALLKKYHITIVFPLVKDTGGQIFWHSEKFASSIHPDYRDFDLLEAAVRKAKAVGIKIHPWLCDFPESKDSAAYTLHPEWAMLNPEGGTTAEEKLSEDRPYSPVWMCPVRRPGYADQWLIPMMEEIAENYDVDGIHHDYVRYPGDVAPDSYCFCDTCLEHYSAYNHLIYTNRPQDRIPLKVVLPRKEANWHYDLTLLPEGWEKMSRAEKADHLLDGKSIDKNDMDYYLYQTRCDAITRFVEEARAKVRRIKPSMEFSAAVFINPMRSGRHIGQRWTDFVRFLEVTAPMNYRSHFQGSFEDYLAYLDDYIQAQKRWCGGQSLLLPGITGHYIYREEQEPWEAAVTLLRRKQTEVRRQEWEGLMEVNLASLKKISVEHAAVLRQAYQAFEEKRISEQNLVEEMQKILRDPPPGFYPEEKFLRAIETVMKSGADGIVIFSAGILTRNKLWPALEKAF